MATDHFHYAFNPGQPSGQRLRSALNQLEQGRDSLAKELATFTADLTGDGSLPEHYSNATTRYGFADGDDYTKAAYAELQSALFKLTTDAQVDSVDAALRQLFTRLR